MYKYLSAVHLLLINEGQILLQRRHNTGYEDGNYSVIAGHMEGQETVKEAMIREAKEEAGIFLDPDDLKVVGILQRYSKEERIDFFVSASNYEGSIRIMEPNKCDEMDWYLLDNLPSNTIPYIKKSIDNYFQNRYFDTFGYSS